MLNIEKLLSDYKIDFKTSGNQISKGWTGIRTCPFCQDINYHFAYNQRLNIFSCWKCGGKSKLKSLSLLLNIPQDKVKEAIKEYGLIDLQIEDKEKKADKLILPENEGCLLPSHKKYLAKRGFSHKEISSKWNVVSTGNKGWLANRLLIPIYRDDVLVSYHSRDVTDSHKIKALACPREQEIIRHKSLLYGFDNVPGNTVIVSEGPFDVWRWGYGAVCTFGIKFTEEQVALLTSFKNIFIIFDSAKKDEDGDEIKSEKQAQMQAEKLADTLSIFHNVWIISDIGGDPADLSQKKADALKQRFLRLVK